MLDSRLFSLLETLARAGLGWLVREITETLLAGRLSDEPAEALEKARSVVFRKDQNAGTGEVRPVIEADAEPFTGDEQIAWAAAHVAHRIEQLLDMSTASLSRLDRLIERDQTEQVAGKDRIETALILADEENTSEFNARNLATARDGLEDLHRALEAWSTEALRAGI